ncbi:MAG: bifunctional acetate--CoA ligase family protein/GNAT family N-acetyltransferase [Hyphomicrobiales bacterium]|nr:bifunctional acetate--CoA ligase family protein/GNAT family N-acetyltransferase [Hyphomicrobiales bacterium]
MGTRALDTILAPKSICLIGASPRPGSSGQALLANLTGAGFKGEITLVNPRYQEIDGRRCFPDIASLAQAPDLVVIVAPEAHALSQAIDAEKRGVRGAVVMTPDAQGREGPLSSGLRAIAQRSGMRIVGPACLGVLSPRAGLNASLSHRMPPVGDLAVVSQSGAIASALLAWGQARQLGFSGLVSSGQTADVDFSDLLDFYAQDVYTKAILLYIEQLNDPQSFMSAARAAARAKPVIVMKSGRHRRGPRGGALAVNLAGPDAVYDAAFRRAGLLRVADIDELFDAAEALSRVKPFPGRRLAIISNGGGIGRLAADRLFDMQGALAPIEQSTWDKLSDVLPENVARQNPIDIDGDADTTRFTETISAIVADRSTDALLVMHAPTALSRSQDVAEAVAKTVVASRKGVLSPKPVFAAWFGATPETDRIFEQARIPHYQTGAVRGFMHMVRWNEAREFLMSAPPNMPENFDPDVARARAVVRQALDRGHKWLAPVEITMLLDAYDIPVAPARFARSPEEAAELARLFIARAGACVIKIASRDIEHKSDVGGVALELRTPDVAAEAAREMMARIARERPDAKVEGVTVHPMIKRPHGRELFAGLADDATFGPVVVFGRGGKAVEVIEDRALALPPLDLSLAHDMIARTRVRRILRPYRDVKSADVDAVALTLVKLSQLAADVPEVRTVDLNPLLADDQGVMVVDARISVEADPRQRPGHSNRRFAVAPYPKDEEREVVLKNGKRIFVRPVRPEDEETYKDFFEHVPPNDLRLRFFAPVKAFTHAFLARLTQIDYARAYVLAAFDVETKRMLGGVRLMMNADLTEGEYAILVGSEARGTGLGWILMTLMIEHGRAQGLHKIEGQVLTENGPMLKMCRALGFTVRDSREEPGVSIVELDLSKEKAPDLA